ncbi:MAG TPA: DUF2269 family protein [Actinomycetota bacterium]|jgi:uncharacterized membrane protein|nr:DUF2269 family protein [Actinomycetota bacterium]
MTVYDWVKFAHILLAIVAVGFNASYGIWLARAAQAQEHELHVLRGIKILDDRFANPAYGLLLVTGLWMVVISPWEITTFWILGGLILWAVVILLGVGLYTPTLRRQIHVLEAEGPGSEEFQWLSRRGTILGIVLGIMVVMIVGLMVLKPSF